MLISIVTLSKGRLHQLKQTAPILIGQQDLEYVLVDWDCPEQSGQWLLSHHPDGKVVFVKEQPVLNVCAARNVGALASSGQLLVFTDVDMVYDHQFSAQVRDAWSPDTALLLGDREGECGFLGLYRDDFLRTGGYDESWESYGYDDLEMRLRVERLGLRQKRIWTLERRHLHHTNDDRTRFFKEPDKRRSKRINAARIEEEPIRVFHERILRAASGSTAPAAPTPAEAGDAERTMVGHLMTWKQPRRLLVVATLAASDRTQQPRGAEVERLCAMARGLLTASRVRTVEVGSTLAAPQPAGLGEERFDMVVLPPGDGATVRDATRLALRAATPTGTVVWLGHDQDHGPLVMLLAAVSAKTVTLVEDSSVAFVQLTAAVRQQLLSRLESA